MSCENGLFEHYRLDAASPVEATMGPYHGLMYVEENTDDSVGEARLSKLEAEGEHLRRQARGIGKCVLFD